MINRAREEGVSVILIVHNMHHVYPIADRFIVLSHGKLIGKFDKAEKTLDELSEFIVSGVAETD